MTAALIQTKLTEAFHPNYLEVLDNTLAHAGHAGAQNGGGHFHVTIVCSAFEGMSLVRRHQLIYQALGEMMKQQIHALGIDALTPSENSKEI